ncbi:AAA-ATPase At2g18193-like [Quercus robur]|uniref:AAA-ATPase At2g18193-like n=1 Tax=Quercus robur TaxID=38942 RepID=UPI002163A047|nr:AAA-ATPase At2g18193-like [Quercus robur]
MFSFKELLSSLTPLFTAAIVIVLSPIVKELIPSADKNYLVSIYGKYFFTPQFTLLIEKERGGNQIYETAATYLRSKIAVGSSDLKCLKVRKTPRQQGPTVDIVTGQVVMDSFKDINWLKWKLCQEKSEDVDDRKTYFELSFEKKFKEVVLKSYLPHVISCSEAIQEEERAVKLYSRGLYGRDQWSSVIPEHPATFEKLAMDTELKRSLIDDLNRFVKRKEWYKKVGRAWKRGYLIYGPPGTGKSTLIAAMANHLKFDIYDLNISSINSDSDLRKTLHSTTNRSIVVIEDIDCAGLEKRGEEKKASSAEFTLSGLLNIIDGLWSSCVDERIIVFTTNHKDKLDPALLRPGHMDVHMHMSYCTMDGFKLLASNLLNIEGDHQLYREIEGLLKNVEVIPAEIAEELLKKDDPDVSLSLRGIVEFLEEKKT